MESILCSAHITKISSRNKNCLSIDFENDYNIFYHMAVFRKNHDFIKYIIAAKTVLKWNIYHKTNPVIFLACVKTKSSGKQQTLSTIF